MSDQATTLTFPNARIAVFAREPELGQVKTRLLPALGPAAALALYRAMADRTLHLVRSSELAALHLWVTSNPSHEYFLSYCNSKEIFKQVAGDLGQKMAACAATELAQDGVDSVIIIGTDCPALTAPYLNSALSALEAGQDVVLGPAGDGGYVLIGLRQPYPELFRDIPWGGPDVLACTLAKLEASPLKVTQLPLLWDVDTAEDLPRLATLQPPLAWP